MSHARPHRRPGVRVALGAALLLLTALLATAAAAAPGATCGVCGKNLIKNPGAESGAGITAVGAFGAVPGWTNDAGQFGAASLHVPERVVLRQVEGLAEAGEELLLRRDDDRGRLREGDHRQADDQASGGRGGTQVTLGGWLGNYGSGPSANMTQVRAEFADASGAVLARLRIGNDTTISGTDMAFRSRKGTVPKGATQVTIVVSFANGNNYKLAGADDLSLVLA